LPFANASSQLGAYRDLHPVSVEICPTYNFVKKLSSFYKCKNGNFFGKQFFWGKYNFF